MPKSVFRYRTPGEIDENAVRGEYYQGIVSLLEQKGFKSVPGFNGLPFWEQPIVCYHETNPDVVVFNPYIHGGMSAPPTSLDVIVISENEKLAGEIREKFPGLVNANSKDGKH